MTDFHISVLLQEAIAGLKVEKNKKYIDATLGGGGHAREILRLGGGVLGIDVDQEAIDYVRENLKSQISNLKLVRGNFRDIDRIARLNNFEEVAGIIFDLGVSSHQIDAPERGFSFQNEGPLDMRMDQELGVRALDLIKILTKDELNEIFNKFGEESRSWQISEAIVSARSVKEIKTTRELAKIVFKTAGESKKIFQALRIVVNDELNSIMDALPKALGLLEPKGRLAIISFHSLEDRIIKKHFLEFERKNMGRIITQKPIVPSDAEIALNKRARSAKLRIFERN
ncbi:MAG: 16S rRNA (cytosine(1402)-N(4))-methyltransferase RsmH [Candidatus Levybacteria bacterium]|nr:16S rRNA (cytosine(1402)-N(4))-methyltransferase RsmH [Candidatus Levybacteria bacterium]